MGGIYYLLRQSLKLRRNRATLGAYKLEHHRIGSDSPGAAAPDSRNVQIFFGEVDDELWFGRIRRIVAGPGKVPVKRVA